MKKSLMVENFSLSLGVVELVELFEKFGTISAAMVTMDPTTGRSGGVAYVDLEDGADSAMTALNGTAFHGQSIVVKESLRSVD